MEGPWSLIQEHGVRIISCYTIMMDDQVPPKMSVYCNWKCKLAANANPSHTLSGLSGAVSSLGVPQICSSIANHDEVEMVTHTFLGFICKCKTSAKS